MNEIGNFIGEKNFFNCEILLRFMVQKVIFNLCIPRLCRADFLKILVLVKSCPYIYAWVGHTLKWNKLKV